LLNLKHPEGASKARFFNSFGFSEVEWESLAIALGRLAESGTVATAIESVHGQKYIIEGAIETPSGKAAMVRTVWIVDAGSDAPRLVTAYPC
jgi:hypothetical protein